MIVSRSTVGECEQKATEVVPKKFKHKQKDNRESMIAGIYTHVRDRSFDIFKYSSCCCDLGHMTTCLVGKQRMLHVFSETCVEPHGFTSHTP